MLCCASSADSLCILARRRRFSLHDALCRVLSFSLTFCCGLSSLSLSLVLKSRAPDVRDYRVRAIVVQPPQEQSQIPFCVAAKFFIFIFFLRNMSVHEIRYRSLSLAFTLLLLSNSPFFSILLIFIFASLLLQIKSSFR